MEEDGVWRTIHGVRVFIRNGETPMDAFIRQQGKSNNYMVSQKAHIFKEIKRKHEVEEDAIKHNIPNNIKDDLLSNNMSNRTNGMYNLVDYVANNEEWVDISTHNTVPQIHYKLQVFDRNGDRIDINMADYTYDKINSKIANHYKNLK